MKPLLSILIPTYARTANLQEALWSAVNQTLQVPIIVLNDCPRQVIECYHPLVRVINLPKQLPSLGAKRNAMLDYAKSEWITWLDDDDLLLPTFTQELIEAFDDSIDSILSRRCWMVSCPQRDGVFVWKTTNKILAGAFRTSVAKRLLGFPANRDCGEDRVFVEKFLNGPRTCSLLKRAGYCYRWDSNACHLSGLRNEVSAREGYLANADFRFHSGQEPSGNILISPSFQHNYFKNFPMHPPDKNTDFAQNQEPPHVQTSIVFADIRIDVHYPESVSEIVQLVIDGNDSGDAFSATHLISIFFHSATGRYSLSSSLGDKKEGIHRNDLGMALISCINQALRVCRCGLLLNAGAVAKGNDAVLLLGGAGSGKTFLLTWLLRRSWRYLADSVVLANPDHAAMAGLKHPIRIRKGGAEAFASQFALPEHTEVGRASEGTTLLPHQMISPSDDQKGKPLGRIMVFVEFRPGEDLSLDVLSAAQAALLMMPSLRNGLSLAGGGFPMVAKWCKTVPALRLKYGDYSQLSGVLDKFIEMICSLQPSQHDFFALWSPFSRRNPIEEITSHKNKEHKTKREKEPAVTQKQTRVYPIPEATPRGPAKKLTIGMATYDDYDGVYFTIQSIRMYHQEILDEIEFVVVDNHPDGPCSSALKKLEKNISCYRYIPENDLRGPVVKDVVFRESQGDFVLIIDCHVMIVPGAIRKLIEYFEDHDPCHDLLQGPIIMDDLSSISTNYKPVWRSGMFGTWEKDPRGLDEGAEPFEIVAQGTGLFACRRASWPGFNPRFRGFAGTEGYMQEKFRRKGAKVLCLPFLRWLHRFERPMGVPYPITWKDRIYNFMVGYEELGLDNTAFKAHFVEMLGVNTANKYFTLAEQEIASPFHYFDAIYCLVNKPRGEIKGGKQICKSAFDERSRVYTVDNPLENSQAQTVLSHQAIISKAKRHRLANVLIAEEKVYVAENDLAILAQAITDLRNFAWNIFSVQQRNTDGYLLPESKVLSRHKQGDELCTQCVAYSFAAYDSLLAELPDSEETVSVWLQKWHSLANYLGSFAGTYSVQM